MKQGITRPLQYAERTLAAADMTWWGIMQKVDK